MADDENFEELMKDWQLCYSNRKKRDYYFNSKTGESLWTIEEVKENVRNALKLKPVAKSTKTNEPAQSSKSEAKEKKAKTELHSKTCSAKDAPSEAHTSFEMQIDPPVEDRPEQMDYEIVEINRLRKEIVPTSKTDLDMDVEMNQVDIDTNSLKLILVLDTNIFISNLIELEETAGKHKESILFMVPWVVLQELDGLKSSRIWEKAKKAIHFIHGLLSCKAANNFIFENSIQDQQGTNLIKCEKNDDKILRTALRLKTECPNYRVMIVSNDINLINKSLVSSMEAIVFSHLAKNLETILGTSQIRGASTNDSCQKLAENVQEPFFTDFFIPLSERYGEHLSDLIVGSLSIFFEYEMQQVYQELWQDLLLHKPPWSLATLIPNMNKSFSALFGFTGQKKSIHQKALFDSLKEKVDSYLRLAFPSSASKTSNSLESLRLIVKISVETLNLLEQFNKTKYGSKFIEYLKKLEYFKSSGVKMCNIFNLICKFTTDGCDEESSGGVEILDRIWQKYHSMSELTLDGFKIYLSNCQSSTINVDQYRLFYEALICAGTIKSFRKFYEKCIDDQTRRSYLASLSRAFYALLKLFNFENEPSQVCLLNVNNELKKHSIIDKTLKHCFADPMNRETMKKGLNQLKEFEGKLESMSLREFFALLLNQI